MTAVNMKWAKAYHLCKIVAADIESARVSPLCCVAYAYDAVKRENTELLNAIWIVESHIGHKSIHPIDRGGGGDLQILFEQGYPGTACDPPEGTGPYS